MNELIRVEGLSTHYSSAEGVVRAVDNVSLEIRRGESVALVGESGSGKSTTAFSMMRLISRPGRIVGGKVLLDGRDILALDKSELSRIRGREISMVFQEPMTFLNPLIRVGEQIAEAVRIHQGIRSAEAREHAIEALRMVQLPNPETVADYYPHQLSGGMRQRVLIAIAIACRPSLLIADEPTTALDVTVQARILSLIDQLQEEFGMAVILISHDLAVIAENADEMAVMYLGEIVESGSVDAVFSSPLHPYTLGLFQSIPALQRHRRAPLNALHGSVPGPYEVPRGCVFKDRCPFRHAACEREPPLVEPEPGHAVKCWLYGSPP